MIKILACVRSLTKKMSHRLEFKAKIFSSQFFNSIKITLLQAYILSPFQITLLTSDALD